MQPASSSDAPDVQPHLPVGSPHPLELRALRIGVAAGRSGRAARSLALHVLTMFVVVSVVFALPRALPGDPLVALQDPSSGSSLSPEVRSRLLAYYDLDRPLSTQYVSYLSHLARADLGWSISRNTPVLTLIAGHLPWTLLLIGISFTIAAALSFVAGVIAAWRRGRLPDRLLVLLATGLRAVPPYALAALLLIALAVLLPVFPLAGARTPFASSSVSLSALADVARHLVLPVTALSLSLLSTKFLLVRNTVITSLGADYMELARAKGLPERLLKYRHAGRNALLPFVTALGVEVGFAVGFSIFVESVFAYPGLGTLILRGVETRDYPVLEGTFLVAAVLVVIANMAVDLVYARLDPRAGTP